MDATVPMNDPRRVVLVLRDEYFGFKVAGNVMRHLKELQHLLVRTGHDAFDKGWFSRRKAVASELFTTIQRGVDRVRVD